MMTGRKPNPDNKKGSKGTTYPKVEKPEYQQMYAYYQSLGMNRSFSKVAQHFNKSKNMIGLIRRGFDWRGRITKFESTPQDVLVIASTGKIDSVRHNIIEVVHEITDTLHELMYISKGIRDGKFDDEIQERQRRLVQALGIWGFEWKGPKDLSSLIKTLKEVKDFNAADHSKSLAGLHAQQFNIDEFNLVVKDD